VSDHLASAKRGGAACGNRNPECFQPEAVEFLQRIFNRPCIGASFVRGTFIEEFLVASLIQLYQLELIASNSSARRL